MNDNELIDKYIKLFLNSDILINWYGDITISNYNSPRIFACIFSKQRKNQIGFKISIVNNEKDISVFTPGEEDAFFDLSDAGFKLSMDKITEYIKKLHL